MRSICLNALLLSFLLLISASSFSNEPVKKAGYGHEAKLRVDQLKKLSDEYPDSAIAEADQLMDKFEGADQKNTKAGLLWVFGNSHDKLKNHRQALEYYEQALSLYRESEDKTGTGAVLNSIGQLRQRQGDYKAALNRYAEAAVLFKEISNDSCLSVSYSNIGNLYHLLGRYDKALEFFTLTLRINEKLKNSPGLSSTFNNLGDVYLSLEDYKIADDFYTKAMAINRTLNQPARLAISYNNLAKVYVGMRNYTKALENNRMSIELSRKINDQDGVIQSLMNTGEIYIILKEYEQARVALNEAMRIANGSSNGFLKASISMRLGQLYLGLDDFDESINYYNHALTFAEQINSFSMLPPIYKGMASAWQGKGDFKKAFDFLSLHSTISDSIYNEENNKHLNMLRVGFEFQNFERDNQKLKQENIYSQLALKRQQTIRNLFIGFSLIVIFFLILLYVQFRSKNRKNRLLAERNQQVIRQKDELNQLYKEQFKLNETKNKFFSIIAHDLKSPFQTILGFSELLSFEYDNLTEQQRKDSAINILKVSSETFRLIENLLEWGRTQTGATRATFKLFNVKDLVLKTVPVFNPQLEKKQLKMVFDLPDFFQGWADPDMIMAVLRNIISNAIKFSPLQSEILIGAQINGERVHISIADSGSGIPDDIKEKLFTLDPIVQRAGTMGERGTGLGLALCMEFMELNQGNILVKSMPGKGSEFTVVFQSGLQRPKK